MKCSGKLKIYRIYNINVHRGGTPFVRCETHAKEQKLPDGCVLREVRMICEVLGEPSEPKAAATRKQP